MEPEARDPERLRRLIGNELGIIHNIDTSQIDIVVMVDRSSCELYHLDRDQSGQNIQEMAPGYPQERDMADSQTLLDFFNYARDTCPADRYLLQFIAHGWGHQGMVAERDDPPRSDREPGGYRMLYLHTIADAMSRSGIHFDIVMFNCCTMGTIEVGMSIQPYCDVMIASQDNMDMTFTSNREFLSFLVSNPSETTEELANEAVQCISREHQRDQNLTISAINLSRLANVLQHLNSIPQIFISAITNNTHDVLVRMFLIVRNGSTAYPHPPTTADPPGWMVDIYDFARKFKCIIGQIHETCHDLPVFGPDYGRLDQTTKDLGIETLTYLMDSLVNPDIRHHSLSAVLNCAQGSQRRSSFGLSINFPLDNYPFYRAAQEHSGIPPYSCILQHAGQWVDLIHSLPFPLS